MTLPERIVDLLADYRGLPLHTEDVAEELHACRKNVKRQLRLLEQAGEVMCRPDPEVKYGRLLYWLPGEGEV